MPPQFRKGVDTRIERRIPEERPCKMRAMGKGKRLQEGSVATQANKGSVAAGLASRQMRRTEPLAYRILEDCVLLLS